MKESFTTNRPHVAENFVDKLMSQAEETETHVTFSRDHLRNCLASLGRDVMMRERQNYERWAMKCRPVLQWAWKLSYGRWVLECRFILKWMYKQNYERSVLDFWFILQWVQKQNWKLGLGIKPHVGVSKKWKIDSVLIGVRVDRVLCAVFQELLWLFHLCFYLFVFSYTMYYENMLRTHHQLLYKNEQVMSSLWNCSLSPFVDWFAVCV